MADNDPGYDDPTFGPRLLATYRALSEADKSVIVAASRDADATMTTVKGSANDRFWTMLAKVGWTEGGEPLPGLLLEVEIVGWRITALGRQSLPHLFRVAHGRTH